VISRLLQQIQVNGALPVPSLKSSKHEQTEFGDVWTKGCR